MSPETRWRCWRAPKRGSAVAAWAVTNASALTCCDSGTSGEHRALEPESIGGHLSAASAAADGG